MRSNMTGRKRVAASVAATALLAGGMALAAPGAASAAPVMGSADSATDFANGLDLWELAATDGVEGPKNLTVVRNDDGAVALHLEKPAVNRFDACALAIVPVLETPPDGVANAEVRDRAVYSKIIEGPQTALDEVTQPLDPGVYAVVSHCSRWLDKVGGELGVTAHKPVFFATLGAIGDIF